MNNDDPAIRRVDTENLTVAQANAVGTITKLTNERALKEMKLAFQPKTRLQRSQMWNYLGALNPRVMIGVKLCDLGCKLCYLKGIAVGAQSTSGSPGSF